MAAGQPLTYRRATSWKKKSRRVRWSSFFYFSIFLAPPFMEALSSKELPTLLPGNALHSVCTVGQRRKAKIQKRERVHGWLSKMEFHLMHILAGQSTSVH